MNVAIIDGDVPYPATSGKRLRTLNLMLALARRHRITYVGRGGDPAESEQARAFLKGHGVEPTIVDDPLPQKKGAAFYARLAGNLFSRLPYSVSSHRSAKMREAVAALAARDKVDLWQVEWSGYLYAVEGRPEPVVLQAHNVDSLIWQRYREAERGRLKRWYIAGQWRKFLRFEGEAFRRARRVVAVTPEDAELARRLYGLERIDVVDDGVDVASFRGLRASPDARRVLYLGALDWRPNADALGLLLDDIFPAVRAREPGATLSVVGRRPPEALRHPGQAATPFWRQETAELALRAWGDGGEVWLSRRLLADAPHPAGTWAEGDDPRLSWPDIPAFFRRFRTDQEVGGADGFVRVERGGDNERLLREALERNEAK
jgi:hypothetical protein